MLRTLPVSCLVVFFVLIFGNVQVYQAILAPRVLGVSILDVGKDSVVLLRTPTGATLLINVGPDAGILRALGTALPEWQRRIDVVVLTSATAGTAGGLPAVLSRYQVVALVRPETLGSKSFEAALAAAASAHPDMRRITWQRGVRLSFGDGAYADILSPENVFISDGKTMTKVK